MRWSDFIKHLGRGVMMANPQRTHEPLSHGNQLSTLHGNTHTHGKRVKSEK